MALYLLNDDHDEAMRVAGEVLPEPPRRATPANRQAALPTGLYL
jgi:hypothetical protein